MTNLSLKSKQQVLNRVQTYAKFMDGYGIDALLSLFPVLGDGGISLISTSYMVYEANNMGLSQSEIQKILTYQLKDFLIGVVPVLGDIADFFYTGNTYALQVFEDHVSTYEKSIKEPIVTAIEKEITVL